MRIYRWMIIVVFIAVALSFQSLEGDACKKDSDCQSLCTCVKKKCTHIPLWPIRTSEVLGSLWVAFLNSISSAAGHGFGGSSVPWFQIFLHYGLSTSISLAYAITFGGGCGNLLKIIQLKHKETGGPIIHYNIALICIPALVFGSQIGVLIRRVITSFASSIILLILYTYGAQAYCRKFFHQYKLDKEKFAKLKKEKKEETERKQIELTEAAVELQPISKPVESITYGSTETPQQNNELPVIASSDTIKVKDSNLAHNQIDLVVKSINTESEANLIESHDPKWLARREFLIARELQQYPWYKLKEILLIVILIFLLIIFRGGKGIASVVGITYCSHGDWGMFATQLVVYSSCLIRNARLIQGWEDEKKKYGIKNHPDFIQIYGLGLVKLCLISVVAGIIGAIASLGGATIMVPTLYSLGLSPQIAAYSVGAFTIFTTFNSLVQTYFTGTIVWQQILWLWGLAFIFSSISARVVAYLFKKTGRQAWLPFIIFWIFVAAFASALSLLIINSKYDWSNVSAPGSMCH